MLFQTRKSWVVILTSSLLFTYASLSCNGPNSDHNLSKKHKTIAMNVVVSKVPFWNDSKAKLKELEKTANIKTFFSGPDDVSASTQINQIDALIAQKVDGIIITPTDSKALVSVIDKAVANGIPVMTFLGDVPDSKRMMYITSELEEASKTVAEYVFKNNKPEGKAVIMLGALSSEEQRRRADGFKQAIANFPNLKIVDIIEDNFDASIGAKNLKPVLTREKNVNYIFGCDSRSAAAARIALNESAQTGNVVITGWDYDDDVLAAIQKGQVYVSAAQQMTFMTQIAVNILYSYIDSSIYPSLLNFKKFNNSPVPTKLVVPINLVTKENAQAYFKNK